MPITCMTVNTPAKHLAEFWHNTLTRLTLNRVEKNQVANWNALQVELTKKDKKKKQMQNWMLNAQLEAVTLIILFGFL